MAATLRQYFQEQIDLEKVMLMLLLHDVGEIGIGDTSAFDEEGKATSFERELKSVQESFALLPKTQMQQYLELWKEFEKSDSHEARDARCIDALAPLMNHLLVTKPNENPSGLTKSQVIAKKSFIQNDFPAIWHIVEDLVEKSVQKGLYKKE